MVEALYKIRYHKSAKSVHRNLGAAGYNTQNTTMQTNLFFASRQKRNVITAVIDFWDIIR
jgi:hypothetical protein